MDTEIDRIRDISLAGGETRMLFVRANTMIVGVRGSRVIVQEWVPLGDYAFSISVPVAPGQTHAMAYGGRVLLHAGGPAQVRVLEQASRPLRAAAGVAARARSVIAWVRRHSGGLSGPA